MDHTPFIWSAYGLTAAVLAWTALAPVLRRRRTLAQLEQLAAATRIQATRTQATPEHEHDTHA